MAVIIELAAKTSNSMRMHALRDRPEHAGVVYDEEDNGSWIVFDDRAVDMPALRMAVRHANNAELDNDQYHDAWDEIDRVIGDAMICDCNSCGE